LDATLAGGEHIVGDAQDSLAFAADCPKLDTLYLDPPYNFRQYTSYYFLPNVITRYPFIDDLDGFFTGVEFVRGQNMETDHNSVFCRKADFIPALGTLIERVPTKTVILSYFNGRNHWNDFKESPNDIGREHLSEFFSGSLFEKNSLSVVPVPRKNYQSYRGYKALDVNEYLFVARKRA
jgi:adenine-specific DNA methylase